MGAGDLDLEDFVAAGRMLFSVALVKGFEGNLSTWDGESLRITRTGSALASLGEDDILLGTLDAPPANSSSDLSIHIGYFRERGPGAVAHAHPAGSVPDEWREGEEHGSYAFSATLLGAVESLVAGARARA